MTYLAHVVFSCAFVDICVCGQHLWKIYVFSVLLLPYCFGQRAAIRIYARSGRWNNYKEKWHRAENAFPRLDRNDLMQLSSVATFYGAQNVQHSEGAPAKVECWVSAHALAILKQIVRAFLPALGAEAAAGGDGVDWVSEPGLLPQD